MGFDVFISFLLHIVKYRNLFITMNSHISVLLLVLYKMNPANSSLTHVTVHYVTLHYPLLPYPTFPSLPLPYSTLPHPTPTLGHPRISGQLFLRWVIAQKSKAAVIFSIMLPLLQSDSKYIFLCLRNTNTTFICKCNFWSVDLCVHPSHITLWNKTALSLEENSYFFWEVIIPCVDSIIRLWLWVKIHKGQRFLLMVTHSKCQLCPLKTQNA